MDSPNDRQQREDEIAAYVDGDLPAEARQAFERRLESDEPLRREVAEWRAAMDAGREWAAGAVPGIERADKLGIPEGASMARVIPARGIRRGRSRRFHYASRFMAVAAVFAAGFAIGKWSQTETTPADRPGSAQLTASAPAISTPATPPGSQETPAPPVVKASSEAAPPPTSKPAPAEPPTFHYTDDKGRLVVETTLKESGARALWVVDGAFRLADSSKNE